jgi:hypothetical protein
MGKWIQGRCIYCGQEGRVTDDHIPPKCLFLKPRPSSLITVPSCGDCNGGASNDDEYFKRMLVLRSDLHEHPVASCLRASVIRSFHNPRQVGFRKAFLRTVRQTDLVTPAGLYIGSAPAYDVSNDRMHKVAERIVAGLYHRTVGPWDSNKAEAQALFEPHTVLQAWQHWVGKLLTLPETVLVPNAFSYRLRLWREVDYASAWLLTFYDVVHIVGVTTVRGTEPLVFDELNALE